MRSYLWSNPTYTDVDGDGFTDANDPQPLEFNLTISEVYGGSNVDINGVKDCIARRSNAYKQAVFQRVT